MNKTIKHTYQIAHFSIDVNFCEFVVSIDFSPYKQTDDLQFLYGYSPQLIALIQAQYQEIFGKQLQISDDSFVAEIWGHLFAYRIAIWVKKNLQFKPLQKLAKFVAYRSGIIDCGERQADSNRWIWDFLGKLFFQKYKTVQQ